jgi:hypothetical protein
MYEYQGATFALARLPWQVEPSFGQVDFKTHWSKLASGFFFGQVDFKTH